MVLRKNYLMIFIVMGIALIVLAANIFLKDSSKGLAQSEELSKTSCVEIGELQELLGTDEELIVAGGRDGKINVLSSSLEKILELPALHKGEIHAIAISPLKDILVSGDKNGQLIVWNVITKEYVSLSDAHLGDIREITFSPNGKYFASASKDRTIKIWDAVTLENVQTFKGHKSYVLGLDFSPDGSYLASVGADNLLAIWDTATGEKVIEKENSHYRAVNQVRFSLDGKYLYTASTDSLIKIWDAKNLTCLNTLQEHDSEVLCLAVSPEGLSFLTAGRDGFIKFFDAENGEKMAEVKLANNLYVSGIKFSQDGRQVYVSDISGDIVCLDYQQKKTIKQETITPIYALGRF